MTTAPGIRADEPTSYDPDHDDDRACAGCGVLGCTLYDCPQCGEDVCEQCWDQPCMEPVMCTCGELRVGHEIHWVDCEPLCDSCDPIMRCESRGCGNEERKHEMTMFDYYEAATDWYETWFECSECASARKRHD